MFSILTQLEQVGEFVREAKSLTAKITRDSIPYMGTHMHVGNLLQFNEDHRQKHPFGI